MRQADAQSRRSDRQIAMMTFTSEGKIKSCQQRNDKSSMIRVILCGRSHIASLYLFRASEEVEDEGGGEE